jgi:hypothetical protein
MASVVERLNELEKALGMKYTTEEESDYKESVLRILEAIVKKPVAKKKPAAKKK